MKIAFLDRDGTLIWEPEDNGKIDSLDRLKILPGAIEGMKQLMAEGYELVMVSNQDGIGDPDFPTESFEIPHQRMLQLFAEEGIIFKKIFVCPHKLEAGCNCRKPKTGLVDEFLKDGTIDLENSFMLGDRLTDGEFANNIGVRFIKMETNSTFPYLS